MPLVSVIIPTHNRAKYAVSTIRAVLSLSENIQVVVSDSSLVDEISPEFTDLPDHSRLKFVKSCGLVSVVDNFNNALKAADGEYLIFIGDDDFISAEIVPLAKWAKENAVDSLKLNFPALYYWPDFKHATRGNSYAATLHLSVFSGKVKSHDAKKALAYALDNFGGGVFEMPRAYAGMLSASLTKRIMAKYGALFGGVSPDIYSCALICVEAEKCMLVDYPIVIPGASGQSTTGQSAAGGHRGELRDNPHISAFVNLVWDDRIPEFYSVPTVWSFSLLAAWDKISETNLPVDIRPNFGRLIVKCFAYYPSKFKKNISCLNALVRQYGLARIGGTFIRGVFNELFWGLGRIKNRVLARNIKKNVYVVGGLNQTTHASAALTSYISLHKLKLIL